MDLLYLWSWMDVYSLLIFALAFLVVAEYLRTRRPGNFPPGPPIFPFVGNMFYLDSKNVHGDMTELAEKYGSVYSLRMGSMWVVVLNGLSALHEGLITKGDILSDRPVIPLHTDVLPDMGIIFTNGHLWKQQRRFALFTLKYFGLGKKSLESTILEEFNHLSREIVGYDGKPFNPHLKLNNTISNIICCLVFGHRFEYGDERFLAMIKSFDEGAQLEGSIWAQLYNNFPTLMKWLPGPHHQLQEIYRKLFDFIKKEIEQHKKDWDPAQPRDFIDCYLTEIEKNKKDAEAGFHEENLVMSSFDLFGAGTETTSTTLRWALLYMAKYPEIQEKVQAEIDSVIGQSRQPNMEDRVNVPYTEAVIHEVQRMANIIPLSLPHRTNKEVQLGGYTVPKGVTIIPNLTSVMLNKNEWETPCTFNPGHFLDERGNFVRRAAFMPFSAGKRVCLGENLARMELFLFFTSLLQRFTFSMPPGVEPVLKPRFGVVLTPQHYEICATLR